LSTERNGKKKYSFIFICQEGELEIKAMLLSASLRKHLRCQYELIAATPSPETQWGHLKQETLRFLENLGVETREIVNPVGQHYPIGNKIPCLGLKTGADVNVFLDSDILCVKDFHPDRLLNDHTFLAKPADKATFTCDIEIWRRAYDLCDTPMPVDRVKTTFSREIVPPYFNSGFVAVRNGTLLSESWARYARLLDSDDVIVNKRPHLDQIALAVAVMSLGLDYACLDESYNFPCHLRPFDPANLPFFAHYHWPRVVLADAVLREAVRSYTEEHDHLTEMISADKTWRPIIHA
jgi:hypothetical protein